MVNVERVQILVLVALVFAAGCGAATAEPDPATPRSAGGEQPVPAPAEPPPAEPAPAEPAPSAPATLTVEAAVKGEPKPASVRLIDADGEEAVSGKTGEPLSLGSGEYTLVIAIEDPAVLADRPTQRIPLSVEPGQNPTVRVDFPWATVQLRVRVNGEPENKASVRLLRQGAVVTTVESGGAHVTLSPGRYQAEVSTRGAVIQVPQLLLPEGATQSVPVDVKM